MSSLESIFNHLVIPPNLPGRQDPDPQVVADAILARLIRACDTLARLSGEPYTKYWAPLRLMLDVCQRVNSGENTDRKRFLEALQCLASEESLWLVFHVVEQNAATIIRRQTR